MDIKSVRQAPWHIVPADDKRRARLNLIRHLLETVPYIAEDSSAEGRYRCSWRRRTDP
jgi:polyphosphate kinase 2 (PPK2 family)